MKTVKVTTADAKKNWKIVDASGQTLGRLATEVARVLRGKNKANFAPHIDGGDHVVVINAAKVKLTGNKLSDKVYYSHTKWVGGIKAIKAEDLLAKFPERLVEYAVKGMLPKNSLGRKIGLSLKVYPGPEHQHSAQNPNAMGPRTLGKV